MTDLEHIRAKFAAEYGLSEDMLRNAERWTETTGDLEGVPENLLPGILGMRFGAIAIDTPRSERWSTPEDIDVIADLAYLPDGGYDTAAGACRGHLLDLYLPHDAVLRGGLLMRCCRGCVSIMTRWPTASSVPSPRWPLSADWRQSPVQENSPSPGPPGP